MKSLGGVIRIDVFFVGNDLSVYLAWPVFVLVCESMSPSGEQRVEAFSCVKRNDVHVIPWDIIAWTASPTSISIFEVNEFRCSTIEMRVEFDKRRFKHERAILGARCVQHVHGTVNSVVRIIPPSLYITSHTYLVAGGISKYDLIDTSDAPL